MHFINFGLQKLARGYEQHSIPLDILVTDMDWHITFYGATGKDQVYIIYIGILYSKVVVEYFNC